MSKCTECGYLALRNKESRSLVEAEYDYRKKEFDPTISPHGISQYEDLPLCFAQSYDINAEITNSQDTSNYKDIHNIINKERECTKFTKWTQGFTPKEHMEMLDREEWRNWQEKQRKSDRRWHIIEAILLVIVAGLFTLLGAFISRGSLLP